MEKEIKLSILPIVFPCKFPMDSTSCKPKGNFLPDLTIFHPSLPWGGLGGVLKWYKNANIYGGLIGLVDYLVFDIHWS